MSSSYEGRDPLDIAREAERDINSRENRAGQPRLDRGTPASTSQQLKCQKLILLQTRLESTKT